MQQLIEKVKQWGLDRGIVYTGEEGQDKVEMMEAQARYTLKETAELLDAYADRDIDKINDAIGDILVTLIVGASSDDREYKTILDFIVDGYREEWEPDSNFFMQYIDLVDSLRIFMHSINSDPKEPRDYITVVNSLHFVSKNIKGALPLKDCLDHAYNEIKDRKGKVVNGQFIKD